MVKRKFEILIALLSLIIVSGCATPLTVYSDFSEQKNDINKVSLLTDVIMAEDISGTTDKIDLFRNKEFAEMIIKEVSANLNQKGYSVVESFVFSGCALDAEKQYKVVRTTEDQELETDVIPVGNPPFYIDEALNLDAEAQQNLTSLFRNMKKQIPKKKGEPNKDIHEAAFLKDMTKGDTLVFILVEGRDVSTGKQIGQAVLTGLLTLGTVIAWQTSAISMNLYVIDTRDSKLIWEDRSFTKIRPDEKSLKNVAGQIIKLLPGKNNGK